MKNFKSKIVTILLCITLSFPVTAYAANDSYPLTENNSTYTDQSNVVDGLNGGDKSNRNSIMSATTVTQDLGTSGSVNIATSGIEPGHTRTSDYYYKTSSGYLFFRLTATSDFSITITLKDVNGTVIGQQTRDLTQYESTFSFSALSSTQTFYFTFRNNSQVTSDINGSISAK
jgi:hypothetical protein